MERLHVLYLGLPDCPLVAWLRQREARVTQTMERLDLATVRRLGADFLVCYRYRHILRPDILACFPDRAVNLHMSLLPWNRGADPNLWSFIEGTPKGVTVHYIDEGIDTGDIIAQREVIFDDPRATLATTYAQLDETLQTLFRETWDAIRSGDCPRRPQPAGGSMHRLRDRDRVAHLLRQGWDTLVADLARRGV